MKINYYQLFDVIDEYAVEMLIDTAPTNNSTETTIREVQKLVSSSTIAIRKKSFKKRHILLVAILILMTSGLSFALTDKGAELINNSNRHLIGKDEMGSIIPYEKDGKIVYEQSPNKRYEDVWKTSTIVKKIEPGTPSPSTIKEFETLYDNGEYITPEVMFSSGDFIIFTKENGDGWDLQKGDSIVVTINEYKLESSNDTGQSIVYFQIVDGTIHKEPVYYAKTLEQNFELIAEKSGKYFICLGCNSASRISLKSGKICIKGASNR